MNNRLTKSMGRRIVLLAAVAPVLGLMASSAMASLDFALTTQLTPNPPSPHSVSTYVKASISEVAGNSQRFDVTLDNPFSQRLLTFYFSFKTDIGDINQWTTELDTAHHSAISDISNMPGGGVFDLSVTDPNTGLSHFWIQAPSTLSITLDSFNDKNANGYYVGVHVNGSPSSSYGATTTGFGTPVPEPSTYIAGLSALGMLGLFGFKNRK